MAWTGLDRRPQKTLIRHFDCVNFSFFLFTGDRQWELRRCLPGQALRDWRNGGHQESVAGQAFQEPRTADNETLGTLQHCQGQSTLSFFTQKVGLMKAVAVVFFFARQS